MTNVKELNKLKNEVLSFISKQKTKLIRCKCGTPFQQIGFICDSCGEVVNTS